MTGPLKFRVYLTLLTDKPPTFETSSFKFLNFATVFCRLSPWDSLRLVILKLEEGYMEMSDWLELVSVAVGFLLFFAAMFTAVFQERIRQWWHAPSLKIVFEQDPPLCNIVPTRVEAGSATEEFPAYFCRFHVSNEDGRGAAEDVSVMATRLQEYVNGALVEKEDFLPQHLKWAHRDTPTIRVLPKGFFWSCVIGAVREKHKVSQGFLPGFGDKHWVTDIEALGDYEFMIEVLEPHTSRYHILPPGRYKLTIRVAAENHPPIETDFDFEFTGEWYDGEEAMRRDGLRIEKAPDRNLPDSETSVCSRIRNSWKRTFCSACRTLRRPRCYPMAGNRDS